MNAAELHADLCARAGVEADSEVIEALRRRQPTVTLLGEDVTPFLAVLGDGAAPFVTRVAIGELRPEQRKELADFLAGNTHVRALDVSGASLGNAGALELFAALRRSPGTLEALNISDVGLTQRGGMALALALQGAGLRTLQLCNNRLQAPGVIAMQRAAKEAGVAIDLDGNLCLVETLNAVTHGVGACAAVGGAVCMTRRAVVQNTKTGVFASVVVFVTSLFAMLTCSCLYHASYRDKHLNKKLRKADHSAVFLLIAGSYTPFCVAYALDSTGGLLILCAVWICALVGIVGSSGIFKMSSTVRSLFALAMGWIAIVPGKLIFERLEPGALALVMGGGLAYSFGIIFYFLGRKRAPIMHVIWHIAVMIGGAMHFFAMWRYVLPNSSTTL